MIPGIDELLGVCAAMAEELGWDARPAKQALLDCRSEALALDAASGRPQAEVAALLYVFSVDEDRLRDARDELAIMIARLHMRDRGLTLNARDISALRDLKDGIARGAVAFPEVKRWFEERLVRAH